MTNDENKVEPGLLHEVRQETCDVVREVMRYERK